MRDACNNAIFRDLRMRQGDRRSQRYDLDFHAAVDVWRLILPQSSDGGKRSIAQGLGIPQEVISDMFHEQSRLHDRLRLNQRRYALLANASGMRPRVSRPSDFDLVRRSLGAKANPRYR